MTIRHGGTILLAVFCGIAAINANAPLGTAPAPKPETVRVVVAATDIPRGKTIGREDAKLIEWPRSLAPKSVVSRPEDVVGRAALSQIEAGEPILEPKLTERQTRFCIKPLIPPGMRAFTIKAACVTGDRAGFVLPGNRVDVLLKLRDSKNDGTRGSKVTTTTLLQAVVVLATSCGLRPATDDNGDGPGPTSMTLLVTYHQANLLDLAEKMGQLIVSLCYPVDAPPMRTAGVFTLDQTSAVIRGLLIGVGRITSGRPVAYCRGKGESSSGMVSGKP